MKLHKQNDWKGKTVKTNGTMKCQISLDFKCYKLFFSRLELVVFFTLLIKSKRERICIDF